MRIDRLLCRLRFVKTRGMAQRLVESGHVRCNATRVTRASLPVEPGDVLTLPLGSAVKIVEVLSLPVRRGPASEAQACYRVLDGHVQSAIAAGKGTATKGNSPP
jgi:ribosome-associated heat shock protein Hsp15